MGAPWYPPPLGGRGTLSTLQPWPKILCPVAVLSSKISTEVTIGHVHPHAQNIIPPTIS